MKGQISTFLANLFDVAIDSHQHLQVKPEFKSEVRHFAI